MSQSLKNFSLYKKICKKLNAVLKIAKKLFNTCLSTKAVFENYKIFKKTIFTGRKDYLFRKKTITVEHYCCRQNHKPSQLKVKRGEPDRN